MEKPITFGSIIICNFPFSDHKNVKRRPVLVVYNDNYKFIALPITSRNHNDFIQIGLETRNINGRKLPKDSFINIDTIMTMDINDIRGHYGIVNSSIIKRVKQEFKSLLQL